jgi:hypothetical protein
MKIAMPMGGERRRALTMIADAGPRGQPHALLLANGFSRQLPAAMVRACGEYSATAAKPGPNALVPRAVRCTRFPAHLIWISVLLSPRLRPPVKAQHLG